MEQVTLKTALLKQHNSKDFIDYIHIFAMLENSNN